MRCRERAPYLLDVTDGTPQDRHPGGRWHPGRFTVGEFAGGQPGGVPPDERLNRRGTRVGGHDDVSARSCEHRSREPTVRALLQCPKRLTHHRPSRIEDHDRCVPSIGHRLCACSGNDHRRLRPHGSLHLLGRGPDDPLSLKCPAELFRGALDPDRHGAKPLRTAVRTCPRTGQCTAPAAHRDTLAGCEREGAPARAAGSLTAPHAGERRQVAAPSDVHEHWPTAQALLRNEPRGMRDPCRGSRRVARLVMDLERTHDRREIAQGLAGGHDGLRPATCTPALGLDAASR